MLSCPSLSSRTFLLKAMLKEDVHVKFFVLTLVASSVISEAFVAQLAHVEGLRSNSPNLRGRLHSAAGLFVFDVVVERQVDASVEESEIQTEIVLFGGFPLQLSSLAIEPST